MSNMQKVEDLSHLKDLCIQMLDKLSTNIAIYKSDANKSFEVFANNIFQGNFNNKSANCNYDQLVHSLTSVLKHSLQFSGYLNDNPPCNDNEPHSTTGKEPHSTTDKEPHTTTTNLYKENEKNLENVQGTQYDSTTNYVSDSAESETSINNFAESESIKRKQVQSFTTFPYERRDIKEFGVNHVIKGVITSINKKSFSICPNDWKAKLLEIKSYKNLENLKTYEEAPPMNEIFGIFKLNEGLWRAIRTSDVYTDATQCIVYDALLLDYGETVREYLRTHTFQLCEEIRQIPAQLIECFVNQDEDLDDIRSKLYEAIELRVVENFGNRLLVEVVRDADDSMSDDIEISDKLHSTKDDNSSFETVVEQPQMKLNKSDQGQFESTKDDNSSFETAVEQPQMKLNEADWNMLYEEPFGTSNAMKAVCGYVPRDEKRICPFYDPNNGNCFKGSRCRLEHTILSAEGYTKDLLPTNNATVMDTNAPLFLYKKAQQLLITPTYIMSLTHFYAHVGENSDHVFVWEKDALPNDSGLDHIPHTLELVIARFEDNLYYRAQITEQFNEKMFKVFYIDYGNESIVNINDMVTCDDEFNIVAPAQAVLCRIANVKECENYTKEQYNCGKQFIQARIIDKSIVIEVIDHQHDDLVVKILEPSLQNLPKEMISLGFLKPY